MAQGKPVQPVRLVGMKMFKRGSIKAYMLELDAGSGHWHVAKRYSELRCLHNQLVAAFGASVLPTFPPKEPMLQRLFSEKRTRQEFIGERQMQLQEYLDGILAGPQTAESRPVQLLLQQPLPGALLPFADDRDSELLDLEPSAGRLRAHARFIGKDGVIDIMMQGPSPKPSFVEVCIWPADREEAEVRFQVKTWETSAGFEASRRFELPPGLWNFRATGQTRSETLGSCGLSLQVVCQPCHPGSGDLGAGPQLKLRMIQQERLKTGCFALVDAADEAGGVGPDTSIGLRANKAPCKEKFQTAPDWAVRFR